MNYIELIDGLVIDKEKPSTDDFIMLYKKALTYLNTLKCYRAQAMYFGSMQIGQDMFTWKNSKRNTEFIKKYQACCIFVLSTIYEKLKSDKEKLVSLSLFILYSMLAAFVESKNYTDSELEELLSENDKYNDNSLEGEFDGRHN